MVTKNTFQALFVPIPVVISSGGTVSAAADLVGTSICGLSLPAAFTGTAVSFQTSADNSTWQALYDNTNTLISATVTQARNYSLNPANFAGWRYVKAVSNATEGGARTVTLVCRQV